jgi:hypothetical protein
MRIERLFLFAKKLSFSALSFAKKLCLLVLSFVKRLRFTTFPFTKWLYFAAQPFAKAFIISFIILMNPLGLKTTSQDQSEMLFLDATASSFKAKSELATIILIDDYTLDTYDLSYPISYRTLSRILKEITRYKPDAIFIDLFQHYEHAPNLKSWLSQLEISSKSFPIFMAQNPDFDTKERLSNKNSIRYKINRYTTAAPASWKGTSKAYPLYITHENFEKETPTASMLLYKYFCSVKFCSNDKKTTKHDFDNPMVVRWNNTVNKDQHNFFKTNDKCYVNRSSFTSALNRHFTYGFRTSDDISADRVICPPILTIGVDSILDSSSAEEDLLREAIESRFIFIGYHLSGSSDVVISPVHNQLPGIFFHAMSFINLVTLGRDYWKSPNPINGYEFSTVDLFQDLFYFLGLFLTFYMKKCYEENRIGKSFKITIILNACLLLIMILFFWQYSIKFGPINWIALGGIVSLCLSTSFAPTLRFIIIKLKAINKLKIRN